MARANVNGLNIGFDGDNESNLNADTLVALLQHLDMAPAVIAGGSAGARVSLLAEARHPGAAQALALWWISGGAMELFTLGNVYCVPSIKAAWADGMDAVAALPDWQEVIAKNPSNRQRILEQDRDTFLQTMDRWLMAFCPRPDEIVPGLPNELVRKIDVPSLVFRSSASDANHPRATSEGIAELLPNSRLVEPPWGDREWNERIAVWQEHGVFVGWPPLAAPLAAWADDVL